MKILLANKFLYRRAGAEAYVLDLARALERAGHQVAFFAMKDSRNIQTPWSKYFVDEIHYDRSDGLLEDVRKVGHMIWSVEAAKKFRALLADFKPDVVHLHNIYHHLSPSIVQEAKRAGIPVVQTLHDFKLICPNYRLFTKGSACERCQVMKYWNAVRYQCLNDSTPASAAVALEMWVHRLLRIYENGVDQFIAPSVFLRDLLLRWGKSLTKTIVINNPIDLAAYAGTSTLGEEVVFAGRLAEEKGVWPLLLAAEKLPDIPFLLIGDGPELANIEARIRERKLGNVKLTGFLRGTELTDRLRKARLIVIPSVWYENYPYAALEAAALGKAVVASRIGGIPEIVEDGTTGRLFPPGDVPAMVDAVKNLYQNVGLLEQMGEAAREKVRRENDPQDHLTAVLDIYKQVS